MVFSKRRDKDRDSLDPKSVNEAATRMLRSINQILEHLPRLGYTPEEVEAGRDAYVRRYRGTTRSNRVLTQLDILGMVEEEIKRIRKAKHKG